MMISFKLLNWSFHETVLLFICKFGRRMSSPHSEGNTLTVWFGSPNEEYVCEETGDEVIITPVLLLHYMLAII
jgi:hypothetical protein